MFPRPCSKEHSQLQFRPPTYPPPMRAHSGHNLFRHPCLSPTTSGPPGPECFNNTSVTYANLGGLRWQWAYQPRPLQKKPCCPFSSHPPQIPKRPADWQGGKASTQQHPRTPACAYPLKIFSQWYISQDFPGDQVVKTSPSNEGGAGSIPDQGIKIPHDSWLKNQNISQKQCCKKFSKDFKNAPHQKYQTKQNKKKSRITRQIISWFLHFSTQV